MPSRVACSTSPRHCSRRERFASTSTGRRIPTSRWLADEFIVAQAGPYVSASLIMLSATYRQAARPTAKAPRPTPTILLFLLLAAPPGGRAGRDAMLSGSLPAEPAHVRPLSAVHVSSVQLDLLTIASMRQRPKAAPYGVRMSSIRRRSRASTLATVRSVGDAPRPRRDHDAAA